MTFSANPSKGEKMTGSSWNDLGREGIGAGGDAVPSAAGDGVLLPCPFCGDAPTEQEYEEESLHSHAIVPHLQIVCNECDCAQIAGEDWLAVRRAWNRRVALPAADAAPLSGSAEGVAVTLSGRSSIPTLPVELEDLDRLERWLERESRTLPRHPIESAVRRLLSSYRALEERLRVATDEQCKIADRCLAEAQGRQAAEAALAALRGEVVKVVGNAVLQIEYLHGRFQETGSGNAAIAHLQALAQLASTLTEGRQGLSSSVGRADGGSIVATSEGGELS